MKKQLTIGDRMIETSNRADFYFDPEFKVITKEFSVDYVGISVKGEFIKDPYYIDSVFMFMSLLSDNDAFVNCVTFEDLSTLAI
ncbi:hypothetical protein ACTTZI_004151 [Vibrio vulnificus]